jgi:hypothetical protein
VRLVANRGKARWATLVLLGLFAALVVSGLDHTDDGCAVERHCLACAFALHSAPGVEAAAVLVPRIAPAEPVAAPPVAPPSAGSLATFASRGPPPTSISRTA